MESRENREEDTVGPFGVIIWNDNGEGGEFLQKTPIILGGQHSIRGYHHTKQKNLIDCVLIDKWFRNGIQNSKSMPGADCESDHNAVYLVYLVPDLSSPSATRASHLMMFAVLQCCPKWL